MVTKDGRHALCVLLGVQTFASSCWQQSRLQIYEAQVGRGNDAFGCTFQRVALREPGVSALIIHRGEFKRVERQFKLTGPSSHWSIDPLDGIRELYRSCHHSNQGNTTDLNDWMWI